MHKNDFATFYKDQHKWFDVFFRFIHLELSIEILCPLGIEIKECSSSQIHTFFNRIE